MLVGQLTSTLASSVGTDYLERSGEFMSHKQIKSETLVPANATTS